MQGKTATKHGNVAPQHASRSNTLVRSASRTRHHVSAVINTRPAAETATAQTITTQLQPSWTGANNLSSKIANWIVSTKPTYGLATWLARSEMMHTAKQAGIDIQKHMQALQQNASQLQELSKQFVQSSQNIQYPEYYDKPFHGYSEGNLDWQAAFEMEPMTYAVALRCFKGQGLTAEEAMHKLRQGYNNHIQGYYTQHGLAVPARVLDIGCSTGISTRWYQRLFPQAEHTGLDLSPNFLAVAELQQRQAARLPGRRIKFVRGLAEQTGFADSSFDLVVFSFVAHECPQSAAQDMMTEAKRILARGGVVCFLDNNPRSSVLQQLPPFLAILVKSGEPWTDEYYSSDMEAMLRHAGFSRVATTEPNNRHCTVFGIA